MWFFDKMNIRIHNKYVEIHQIVSLFFVFTLTKYGHVLANWSCVLNMFHVTVLQFRKIQSEFGVNYKYFNFNYRFIDYRQYNSTLNNNYCPCLELN